MIYQIYKAKCIENQKVYIGFTGNFPVRKHAHKKAAYSGKDQAFYKAIRKYGWDSFTWEIIYCSKDKEHTLKEMEPYFISFYDSHNPKSGYNETLGGEGVTGHSIALKKKISEATKLAMARPEVIKATSEAQKKRFQEKPETHGRKGVIVSEETKKKQSQSHLMMSEETKNKIGESSKAMWSDPNKRKKVLEHIQNPSNETRKKMSLAKKGKLNWKKGKKLIDGVWV
jgi:group I intron endonuclease